MESVDILGRDDLIKIDVQKIFKQFMILQKLLLKLDERNQI